MIVSFNVELIDPHERESEWNPDAPVIMFLLLGLRILKWNRKNYQVSEVRWKWNVIGIECANAVRILLLKLYKYRSSSSLYPYRPNPNAFPRAFFSNSFNHRRTQYSIFPHWTRTSQANMYDKIQRFQPNQTIQTNWDHNRVFRKSTWTTLD